MVLTISEQCLASIRHERLAFVEGQTVIEGKKSLYDDFSYSHALVALKTHRNPYFLPWRTPVFAFS